MKSARRRKILLSLVLGVLAAPMGAVAQQASAERRIGFLYFGSRASAMQTGRYAAFLDGLRRLDYVPGKNIILEERFAEGNAELLRAHVAELVGLNVKMIVATGTVAVREAQRATRIIPVVATVTSDPVGQGLAATLARPGGNVTGLYDSSIELVVKQLEVLTLAVPKMSRIAVLSNPANTSHAARLARIRSFAQKSRAQVQPHECRSSGDIERAFADMARDGANALLILADTFFVQQAGQIAELAIKRKLPSIALTRDYVEAGGLFSYGEDIVDNFRLVASYVDKILKGAAPGELPFARTTRIELAVNRKTARALGLRIPAEIILRAERVIE